MGTEDIAIRSVEDWRAEHDRINTELDLAIADFQDSAYYQFDVGYLTALEDVKRLVNGGPL